METISIWLAAILTNMCGERSNNKSGGYDNNLILNKRMMDN